MRIGARRSDRGFEVVTRRGKMGGEEVEQFVHLRVLLTNECKEAKK